VEALVQSAGQIFMCITTKFSRQKKKLKELEMRRELDKVKKL
jgi:hypothetical protein